jgi:beta-galactosidase
MYKVYEWIKSVEKERPIFYEGAEGEWNTDI